MVDIAFMEPMLFQGAEKIGPPDLAPPQKDIFEFEQLLSAGESDQIKIIEEARPMDDRLNNQVENDALASGNRFIEKLDALHKTTMDNFSDVYSVLKEAQNNSGNPQILLKAQAKLYKLSYDLQLSTKIAEKSHESVQTLFKQR